MTDYRQKYENEYIVVLRTQGRHQQLITLQMRFQHT